MGVKIQFSLDTHDSNQALWLARLVRPYADIFEASSTLIKSVGFGVVSKLKETYPDKLIMVNLKSKDGSLLETNQALEAGADIITTDGSTSLDTITAIQKEAKKRGKRTQVNLIGAADPIALAKQVRATGVRLVRFYRNSNLEKNQGASWDLKALCMVKNLCKLRLDVAIAGDMNREVVALFHRIPLYSIVVGFNMTPQGDPLSTAREIAELLRVNWA